VEMEVRELLSKYDYPGDDTPIVRGLGAGRADGEGQVEAQIDALMAAWTSSSRSRGGGGPAVPGADRGHLLDLGPRHGGHGAQSSAARSRWARRANSSASARRGRRSATGVEMFKKQLDKGSPATTAGLLLPASRREDSSAGCAGEPPGRSKRASTFKARFTC